MLLTPTELSRQQPTNAWFCLRAQPKREHIAAACLRQTCEVEVFCPRLRFRKLTSRGPVWFIEAMFPGYLFARFDYANCHRRVLKSPRIDGLLLILGTPRPVLRGRGEKGKRENPRRVSN